MFQVSIESVTIKGFKTFAKSVKFKLSDRLTGVVGPNGSGKSNLVDAIRWGIGEKALNLLRVGKPSDIIYAGIAERKPLSMAEVSIRLDNKHRLYPIEADEVLITRRIFKDGETEFVINDKSCRLKDIGDLFRGTGLGRQTYSVVGQGEVDLVLSATPGERLRTMEELAGVDILRSTKRSVERKLENAGIEMGRISASLAEQKHNYERLRIQSEVLSKYKTISDRVTHLKLQLLLIEIKEINIELESLTSRYKIIGIKQKESDDELESLETSSEIQTQITKLDKEREKVIEEREAALVVKTRKQSELEHKRERIKYLADQIQKQILELESGKKEIISKENLIKKFAEEIDVAKKEVERLKAEREKIEKPEIDESDDRKQRNEITERLDQNKKNANKIRGDISSCESVLTVTRERIRQATAAIAELQNVAYEEIRDENTEENIGKINDEIKKLNDSQTELLDKKDKIGEKIAHLNAEIKSAEKQLAKNKKLLDSLSFLPSKTGKPVLPSELDLSEFNDEEKSFIKNNLDWIVAGDDAPEIMANIPENSGITVVLGVPTFKLTDNIKSALVNSQSVQLTKDGFIVIEGKYILQKSAGVSEISIETEISENTKTIAGNRLETEKLESEISAIVSEIEKTKQEVSEKNREKSEFERIQTEIKTKKEQQERLKEKNKLDLERKKTELTEFKKTEDEKTDELSELQKSLAKAVSSIREAGDELSDFDSKRLSREKERAEFERVYAAATREVDVATNTLKETEQNLERTKKELTEQTQYLEDLESSSKSMEKESKLLTENIIETERELNTANMTIVRTERLEKESIEKREALKADDLERENKIKTVRSRIGRHAAEKHKIELKQVEFRTKRDHLVTDISELGGDPDARIEEVDVDEMKAELSSKARQLAEYGAVNMKAEEEAKSASERLHFIEGQLHDLAQTEANLRTSLSELEAKIKENFETVYRSIEKEFRRLADVLFPEAVGNLKRVKDENDETIGVQVEFMLPGRRMKSLHALSGGEKTLGALALLFAFFRTKSSPFCVLDEVDAALDDNNVERFTRLLRTEAKDTQFVVITHNKETMRWCDTLYGITMDATGTSMVVGVQLDEKDKQTATD
ncbi:MAG: AAA family ATPase [Caldisericia bacterium]